MSVAPDHGSDPLLSKLRVLYLHGLESGLRGKKMTALLTIPIVRRQALKEIVPGLNRLHPDLILAQTVSLRIR